MSDREGSPRLETFGVTSVDEELYRSAIRDGVGDTGVDLQIARQYELEEAELNAHPPAGMIVVKPGPEDNSQV